MKQYNSTTAAVPEIEQPREDTRAHLFTTAAGVILPLLQALATGLIVSVLVMFYAYLLRSPIWWKWGLIVGGAMILVTWLVMLWRWLNLTRPIEQLTGLDLNRDGYVGPVPVVKVQLTSEDGRQTQIAEIPYPDRLPMLARGLLAGRPVSEREWSGHRKLYSQHEWLAVRGVLESRGWIRYKNRWEPRRGFELSPGGRAVMAKLASPSPTPDAYDVQIADQ